MPAHFHLPAFLARRARQETPITFPPARKLFRPEVQIRMLRDVVGWHNTERRVKYHLGDGQRYLVDAETAAVFVAKGYAVLEQGQVRRIGEGELAEISGRDSTVSPGGVGG